MSISKILKQTRVLFLIGLIDLLLTLILFSVYFNVYEAANEFMEENGVFRSILLKSPAAFALLKIASLLLCLSVIELTRERALIKEQVVKRYLKAGIVLYLSLYAVFVIKINVLPLF